MINLNCNLTNKDRGNGVRCKSWGCQPCNDFNMKVLSAEETEMITNNGCSCEIEIKQKDKVIEILKSACEFYANSNNWQGGYEGEFLAKIVIDESDRNYTDPIPPFRTTVYSGGHISRKALKQIEDLTHNQKEQK